MVDGILEQWLKPDGSFRSRKLHAGWDNVPMHRWAQSQMFRALAFYWWDENRRAGKGVSVASSQGPGGSMVK